jgi:hypothetical protein
MNCLQCNKAIEQVDGKRAKKYCSQTCKQAFYRKNKDSAILAQKQGLENAPESATIDDNVTVDNVTPHIVTSNRNNTISDKFPLTHKGAAGNDDCVCMHCQQNMRSSNKLIINHGQPKTIDQLGHNEVNRVSLPGDRDYIGVSKVI